MAIKDNRGLRVNYLIIFLSGFVLLLMGILVFLMVIKNVYGKYEIKEIIPSDKNLSVLSWNIENNCAILYSKYTENWMPEGSTWLSDNIDAWENFIIATKMNYTIIDDQAIERGDHFKYKLLILPGSKSLSDREIIQIKKFLENGGSVFATGGTASYSDEGKWRGWNFFTEVYGLNFTKEIEPEEIYKIHTLRGNLPLTSGIPTGYTLKIATWDRPIYAEILEPRTKQVSFWYNFREEDGLVKEQIKKSAGIAYGNYGKGRFVWYGFEITSVIGQQEDYVNFDKLFRNSINWLRYKPTAFVKDWPGDKKGAAIIIPAISKNIYNARNILGYLNSDGNAVSATFTVDPYSAGNNKDLLSSLARNNNFGAVIDVGYKASADDSVNTLYSKDDQSEAIKWGIDTLQKSSGSKVRTIMPLYGFYDENTLQAASDNNVEFIITDSLTDRSVPKVIIRNDKTMLLITKTARDDIQVIRDYGLTERNFQEFTYFEDIFRLGFEGGLYVLKLHTDYQLQPEYINVVTSILNELKKNDFWITSLDELKNWWLKRVGVEIRFETRSKRRIALEVSNPRQIASEDFVVQVNLNKRVRNIELSSDIINTQIPEFKFSTDDNTLQLYIEVLKPGETRSYLVDFENADG